MQSPFFPKGVSWFLRLAFLFTAAGPAAGEAVRARLVPECATYQPGTSCWLAVHFELDAGWHLYWRNPGDNGFAPTAEWRLPAGFAVREIHWPAPNRFGESPSISYGHERELIWLVELTTPAAPPAGGSVELGARLHWLACAEACVPGRAEVSARLATSPGPAPDPAHTALFARARAALPAPLPMPAQVFAEDGTLALRLDLPAGPPPAGAYFFAAEPETVDHSANQPWRAGAPAARLQIPVSPYRKTPVARLHGVLRVEYPAPVSWSLDLPVQQTTLRGEPK